MVAVGAFTQVQQSLRWFVDNFNTIADWLATLRRVASFRRALVDMDKPGHEVGRIEFAQGSRGKDHIREFDASPRRAGSADAQRRTCGNRARRAHLLITGEAGAILTTMFRAIVRGLWLWGAGRISLPADQSIMFMPRRPYMPPGALRATLAYPSPPTAFQDENLVAACNRAGLRRICRRELDRSAEQDANELASDELQRLAFARLLLHKPGWACIDEAMDSLDDADRKTILALFDNELAETGVITLGRRDLRDGFSSRVLHLIDNAGRATRSCKSRNQKNLSRPPGGDR